MTTRTDHFRRSPERIWARDQKSACWTPKFGAPQNISACSGLWWSPCLGDQQHHPKAKLGTTNEREDVQWVTGADLDSEGDNAACRDHSSSRIACLLSKTIQSQLNRAGTSDYECWKPWACSRQDPKSNGKQSGVHRFQLSSYYQVPEEPATLKVY